MFMNTSPQGSGAGGVAGEVHALARSRPSVVQDVAAFSTGVVNYTGGSFPEQLRSGSVSADFFQLFGAPVVRGRDVHGRGGSCRTGARVAVLSHGLWATPLQQRSRHRRQDDLAQRRAAHHHRRRSATSTSRSSAPRRRSGLPFQLDPEHDRPGALLPGGRPAEARRHARAGAGAAAGCRPRSSARKFPNALGPDSGFSVEPIRERPGAATSARRCSCSSARSASCC